MDIPEELKTETKTAVESIIKEILASVRKKNQLIANGTFM
jgi:hypothetical protein